GEGREPARRERAVDRAVVRRERAPHRAPDLEVAVDDDGRLDRSADRKDRRLRRVEDRGELARAVHPEVGHGRRAALELLLAQASLAGPPPGVRAGGAPPGPADPAAPAPDGWGQTAVPGRARARAVAAAEAGHALPGPRAVRP